MSQKTYMYDTQWTALINAINGGDTSAIATALGQIKTSVDSITTALGSLSTDVTQNATQWSDLITAIGSGGGGGGGNVTIDSTQWTNLLTSIDKGDTTALATALGLIKTSIDSINTSLGSLSADVTQDSTQWSNLVNAITNQSITVDLSNITSDVVSNESTVTPADTVTEALDVLKSDLTDLTNFKNTFYGSITMKGTLGGNVITHAQNNNIGITFYCNSNAPSNAPSNIGYGCYIILKYSDTNCAILCFDSSHFASALNVNPSTATSINWLIVK